MAQQLINDHRQTRLNMAELPDHAGVVAPLSAPVSVLTVLPILATPYKFDYCSAVLDSGMYVPGTVLHTTHNAPLCGDSTGCIIDIPYLPGLYVDRAFIRYKMASKVPITYTLTCGGAAGKIHHTVINDTTIQINLSGLARSTNIRSSYQLVASRSNIIDTCVMDMRIAVDEIDAPLIALVANKGFNQSHVHDLCTHDSQSVCRIVQSTYCDTPLLKHLLSRLPAIGLTEILEHILLIAIDVNRCDLVADFIHLVKTDSALLSRAIQLNRVPIAISIIRNQIAS